MISLFFFFFFDRQKHKDILEKGSLKGNPEHTGSIQEIPKTSNLKKKNLIYR